MRGRMKVIKRPNYDTQSYAILSSLNVICATFTIDRVVARLCSSKALMQK